MANFLVMKEGGRKATPTDFSPFNSFDIKRVSSKFGQEIFKSIKILKLVKISIMQMKKIDGRKVSSGHYITSCFSYPVLQKALKQMNSSTYTA